MSWISNLLHGAILLEELTGSQLVKKFSGFCVTRRFITAFTSARHLPILSQINPFHAPHPTSERSILILYSQFTWYGHVQRMAEERLPKTALKWMPKQKRARGRPKKNWMEGIRKAMNERNLNEGQWEDRKQWSLGVGQRRKTF